MNINYINDYKELTSKGFGKLPTSVRTVLNGKLPSNVNVSLYSSNATRKHLLDVDNNNKIPKHTTGDHALTLSQIVDQIAIDAQAMQSVASFIDTSHNLDDFENILYNDNIIHNDIPYTFYLMKHNIISTK